MRTVIWDSSIMNSLHKRATNQLKILKAGNAAADRYVSNGRHDQASWVLSLALSESFKANPRTDLDEILKEQPSPYAS